MSKPFPYRLYLVISEADCKHFPLLQVVEMAIHGGVDIIQLREKNSAPEALLKKALLVKALTDKYKIPLIINDEPAVAVQINAAGIHVGNNDIPPTIIRNKFDYEGIIGYSIEWVRQLQNEETAAADYLGVSPVFNTSTKTDTVTVWGLAGLRKIRGLTTKPLVAIGGIGIHNAAAVINAGADCLAVVSAIAGAIDPRQAAAQLKTQINQSL